jgi:hypothetical protein
MTNMLGGFRRHIKAVTSFVQEFFFGSQRGNFLSPAVYFAQGAAMASDRAYGARGRCNVVFCGFNANSSLRIFDFGWHRVFRNAIAYRRER